MQCLVHPPGRVCAPHFGDHHSSVQGKKRWNLGPNGLNFISCGKCLGKQKLYLIENCCLLFVSRGYISFSSLSLFFLGGEGGGEGGGEWKGRGEKSNIFSALVLTARIKPSHYPVRIIQQGQLIFHCPVVVFPSMKDFCGAPCFLLQAEEWSSSQLLSVPKERILLLHTEQSIPKYRVLCCISKHNIIHRKYESQLCILSMLMLCGTVRSEAFRDALSCLRVVHILSGTMNLRDGDSEEP